MGGGLVNLTTKSGSNSLHARSTTCCRNKAWMRIAGSTITRGSQKPIDTQNDFGAFISGPVYVPWLYKGRDKTFFMFNYEGFRFDTGGNSLNSAPTEPCWTATSRRWRHP